MTEHKRKDGKPLSKDELAKVKDRLAKRRGKGGMTDDAIRGKRGAEASSWQHWYKTKHWQQLRKAQFAKHRYCQCPHHKGKGALATVVDHKTPHKGDRRLFFDASNLQSMTKRCHDSFKQSQERGGAGFLKGCDARGWPLSLDHEWHSQQGQG